MMYILYDTALNGLYTLNLLQKTYPDNLSLFKGTKDEKLFDVAPYLFIADERFYEKINDSFISLEALVVVDSGLKINDLHAHLKTFVYQKVNGRENYFRFWDARVLTRFLLNCTDEKLNAFFDGINSFYTPDLLKKSVFKYYIKRGKLQSEVLPLNKLFVLENDKREELVTGDVSETGQNKKIKRTFFN